MLAATDIIAYLQQNAAAIGYGKLSGAGEIPAAADQLKKTKSIFVMPPTETAEKSTTGTQVVRQRSTVLIPIVLGFIIRNAQGIDLSGDVDSLREAIKTVMIGWVFDPSLYEPVQLKSFAFLRASPDGMNVFYMLIFFTQYYVRAIPT